MSQRRLLDTNVIIRYIVQDHEAHAKAATRIMEACDRGELTLILLPVVLAECVYVLESVYEHSRADIARVLAGVMSSPGIELADLGVHLDAFKRYTQTKLHFVDCLIAASAAVSNVSIATFDGGFKAFADVRTELGGFPKIKTRNGNTTDTTSKRD